MDRLSMGGEARRAGEGGRLSCTDTGVLLSPRGGGGGRRDDRWTENWKEAETDTETGARGKGERPRNKDDEAGSGEQQGAGPRGSPGATPMEVPTTQRHQQGQK